MDLIDSRKRKRQVPPHLRRRALVSCDRCKQRRVRCVRSPVSDENEPSNCRSCIESGVKCESTLPRKHRIYGSIENLSARYRALDAIVKGLCPNRDTDNIQTLFSIAETNSIDILQAIRQSPIEDALHQPLTTSKSLPGGQSTSSPSASSTNADTANPFESNPTKVQDEKLVPTPHGASHYIGPSSSFGFVVTIRNMVAERNESSKVIDPNDGRASLRADFAGLSTSKALEPHIVNSEDGENGAEESSHMEMSQINHSTNHKRQGILFHPPGDSPLKKKDAIAAFLPARDLADALLEAYFDRVHPNYMVFHRGTFQICYESVWADQNRSVNSVEPGLLCSMFMIFVLGAQILAHYDEQKSAQLQQRYLDLVKARMYQLLHTTSLLNVQALLLLQLHQHNAMERNTSWMLLGCASRMAVALGMHREGAIGGFDSIEREVRRRVWWTLYLFEQNLCTILGRPSAIDDSEVSITLPNENMLDGGDCVPPSYIDYTVRLSKLSTDIKQRMYTTPISEIQLGELPSAAMANHLVQRLESWHRSLPLYLRVECLSRIPKQRRAVLLLHIQYHHAQCLVTRPFILHKARTQLARQLGKKNQPPDLKSNELDLSHACGTFAREIASLLQQLAVGGMFEGIAWIDAYYLYHSILVLSLDFLARPVGQQDTQEDIRRKQAVRDVIDAVRSIKLCPTFSILTQVSLQLAKIVGIFDEAVPDYERVAETNGNRYIPQHQQTTTTPNIKPSGDVEDVINQWFQNDIIDLPWDFFTDGVYEGLNNSRHPEIPMTDAMSGYVPPMISMGSGSVYGWAPIEESYAQSTAGSCEFSPTSDLER